MVYTNSASTSAIGSTLTYNSKLVGEVTVLDGPEADQVFRDVTNFDSPAGSPERKPMMRKETDIVFTCNYVNANTGQAAMRVDALTFPVPLRTWAIAYSESQGGSSGYGYAAYKPATSLQKFDFMGIIHVSGAVTDSSPS